MNLQERAAKHGLDPSNDSVEDTIAQRDALQDAVTKIELCAAGVEVPFALEKAIADAAELAEVVEAIISEVD